ncbi:MAG: ATP-binding protein [Alphaproteobacteria bacterium]|nr:ATP-binding protein [Alphaproteobacteria bacterium]
MIPRLLEHELNQRLKQFPAVALIGPRQSGKTTLAMAVAQERKGKAVYLDLETPADRRKLADPQSYLEAHRGELIVLDEIRRAPELFTILRGEIDARRRSGEKAGQFLILGSAAFDLLRQSSESLAGRIDFLELTPFLPQEIAAANSTKQLDTLWSRGGFPQSFLAASDAESNRWRQAFTRSYLERDIPQFGIRVPAETLERFWTMLAHTHGALMNAQRLAQSLGVSWGSVAHYLDLMGDLLLLRRLRPWSANTGKRLVKSPKIYLRDSGLLHALLNLPTIDDVLGHPISGESWEGFVIEALIAAAPPGTKPYFYRSAAGQEVDLVLEFSATRRWAIEIKKSSAPTIERGFHVAANDLKAKRKLLIYPGHQPYKNGDVEILPLLKAVEAVASGG